MLLEKRQALLGVLCCLSRLSPREKQKRKKKATLVEKRNTNLMYGSTDRNTVSHKTPATNEHEKKDTRTLSPKHLNMKN